MEDELRKPADPPSMKNDHPTLKSVLTTSIGQYLPQSDIDSFVINEVIEYCVGYAFIDLYGYISAPMSQQYKYNHWQGYDWAIGMEYWEKAEKLKCHYLSNFEKMKQEKSTIKVVVNNKEKWKKEPHARETRAEYRNKVAQLLNAEFNKLFGCKPTYDWGLNVGGHLSKHSFMLGCSKGFRLFDDNEAMYYISFNAYSNAKRIPEESKGPRGKGYQYKRWQKYDVFAADEIVYTVRNVVVANEKWCDIDIYKAYD